LSKWSEEEKVLTFLFEAFDEPWKGSNDPFEPEKHWGVFKEDRTPKIAMKKEVYKK
jgi:exo-beta-1,3-glucanase (GH17 family)